LAPICSSCRCYLTNGAKDSYTLTNAPDPTATGDFTLLTVYRYTFDGLGHSYFQRDCHSGCRVATARASVSTVSTPSWVGAWDFGFQEPVVVPFE
jgi:hypothetical protein